MTNHIVLQMEAKKKSQFSRKQPDIGEISVAFHVASMQLSNLAASSKSSGSVN